MHALRDVAQTFGAVVRAVQPRDDREQHLCSADVARRLLTADVLLARLQCEPERGATLRIDRNADEAARKGALGLAASRDVRGVRSAEAERHTKSLCGA